LRNIRGSTRSVKYVIDQAQTTSGVAKADFELTNGVDNATLGQTGVTDKAVPTGAKIKQLSIMSCWGSITGVSTFLHWSIQLVKTGQASVDPTAVGGNPLRTNVMMQGMVCIGDRQNSTVDVKYKIPQKFWRVADGTKWMFVTKSSTNVDTVKQCIYKVFT